MKTITTRPNYPISAHVTPVQRVRVSAKLATRLGLGRTVIADTVSQGFYTSKSWEEYDRLLEIHDRSIARGGDGVPFDIECPEAPADNLQPDRGPPIEARASRSERRYRGERRAEIEALMARDGRVSRERAGARIRARRNDADARWLKICDGCAQPFEARRSDARFHSDTCRKRSARRAR